MGRLLLHRGPIQRDAFIAHLLCHAVSDVAQQIIDTGREPSLEENAFDRLTLVETLQALGDWDALVQALKAGEIDFADTGPAFAARSSSCASSFSSSSSRTSDFRFWIS
mgnify:CR=1 FL=1